MKWTASFNAKQLHVLTFVKKHHDTVLHSLKTYLFPQCFYHNVFRNHIPANFGVAPWSDSFTYGTLDLHKLARTSNKTRRIRSTQNIGLWANWNYVSVSISCTEVTHDRFISLSDAQISAKLIWHYDQINDSTPAKIMVRSSLLTFVSCWVDLSIHQHVSIGRTVTATHCTTPYNTQCWHPPRSAFHMLQIMLVGWLKFNGAFKTPEVTSHP